MKFFVVFACAFIAASADYIAPVASIHSPVIGSNGVSVDTAEVQHARAAHAVHKANALARNEDRADVVSVYAAAPVVAHSAYTHPFYAHHLVRRQVAPAYQTFFGVPSIAPNGVPLDTPEVTAAKNNHFALVSDALIRNGHNYAQNSVPALYTSQPDPYALAATQYAPAPVSAHTAAPHSAAYQTTAGIPQLAPNGAPLETPEVLAAKNNHFALVSDALTRNGHNHYVHNSAPVASTSYAHSGEYAHTSAPYAAPVSGVQSGPQETPEVAAAKSAHFAAHAEAFRSAPVNTALSYW